MQHSSDEASSTCGLSPFEAYSMMQWALKAKLWVCQEKQSDLFEDFAG